MCHPFSFRSFAPDSHWLAVLAVGVAWLVAPTPASAQEQMPSPSVEQAVEDPTSFVTVDWGKEMLEGGVTMIFLGMLSVLLIAFAAERLIVLRRRRFVPPGLAKQVKPLFLQEQFDAVVERCKASDSTLGRVIRYLVEHRDAEPMLLAQSAGDLGARELADQEARNVPFAVIAALAPLLGLLGTMIGMIEAFALVEVFGDEGGASMLAGSISKALITTAAGLILAIPAIACYHWFKHRAHQMTQALEAETDALFSAWFVLNKATAPGEKPTRQVAAAASAPGESTERTKARHDQATRPAAPLTDAVAAKTPK